ncbi:hypothetical protein EGR_09951 [Echinococcus granulosus]|uniref:Uncharacterized protein n=1 Tax=Echinococcus granulosus TaxID=6210 RepID=W6U295_ECHGR|nr:hypothetical protein EGR_09951 [Echinococcus granulosus]EUB55188.1 hypothetical protein EGR_09951 [Echinococcus granulosus]
MFDIIKVTTCFHKTFAFYVIIFLIVSVQCRNAFNPKLRLRFCLLKYWLGYLAGNKLKLDVLQGLDRSSKHSPKKNFGKEKKKNTRICLSSKFSHLYKVKFHICHYFSRFFLIVDAQIGSIEDDTRIIRGPINSSFTLQSVLPDVYKAVVINNRSFPITNGVCTTSYFTCAYIQVKSFALKDLFINYYSASISRGGDVDRKNFGRFKLDYVYTTKEVRNCCINCCVPKQRVDTFHKNNLIRNPNQPFFIDALNMTEAKLTSTFNGTGTPVCRFWFLISALDSLHSSISSLSHIHLCTFGICLFVCFNGRLRVDAKKFIAGPRPVAGANSQIWVVINLLLTVKASLDSFPRTSEYKKSNIALLNSKFLDFPPTAIQRTPLKTSSTPV